MKTRIIASLFLAIFAFCLPGCATATPGATTQPSLLQDLSINPLTGQPWTEQDVTNADTALTAAVNAAQSLGVKGKSVTTAQALLPILDNAAGAIVANQSSGVATPQSVLNDIGPTVAAALQIKAALQSPSAPATAITPSK